MNSSNKNAAAEARGVPETDQLGSRVNRKNSLESETVQGRRGGRRSRAKGDRIEREIVSPHTAIGIKAERYPLSGASRFRGSGHFVAPEKWLGEYDCQFLRRNNAEPLVLLPWRVWARLLDRVHR
jgi:hypothetical protein